MVPILFLVVLKISIGAHQGFPLLPRSHSSIRPWPKYYISILGIRVQISQRCLWFFTRSGTMFWPWSIKLINVLEGYQNIAYIPMANKNGVTWIRIRATEFQSLHLVTQDPWVGTFKARRLAWVWTCLDQPKMIASKYVKGYRRSLPGVWSSN